MTATYDFSGVATQYNVICADGRTIKSGAFAHQDKQRMPLVWRHQHDDISNVLGHGVLVSQESGMRIMAIFNDTDTGKHARTLVQNGDIRYLSVYANDLVQHGGLVSRGNIREVSLVIAGQNPGAIIDDVIVHSSDPLVDDIFVEDTAVIQSGVEIELLIHAADEETIADVLDTFDTAQKDLLGAMITVSAGGSVDTVSEDSDADGPTVSDVYDSLTEKQKIVLHDLVGQNSQETLIQGDDMLNNEEETVTHNIFEDSDEDKSLIIAHAATNKALALAIGSRSMSLSDSVMAHDITNIELLFPEAQLVEKGGPRVYDDDQTWVPMVLDKTYKTPFARIKSRYADLTADIARARGYITEAEKFDSVYVIATRVTTPQTIYTKQSLERDDVIDITDFSIVQWMKAQLRGKLKEEISQAILIGDGRDIADVDKILETNVRPIVNDDNFYAHGVIVPLVDAELAQIDTITRSRMYYGGAGAPTFFCSPTVLADYILVRDTLGHRIYDTEKALAAAIRVSNIVEVPAFENFVLDDLSTLLGIVVNLRDYTVGADKGGRTTFFEDFDIDFNKMKYLLETRMSGALTVPKSALVFSQAAT